MVVTNQSDEKIFLTQGNVLVTSSRFLIGEKTYVLSNISSVSLHIVSHPLKELFGYILGLLAIGMFVSAFTGGGDTGAGVGGLILISISGYLINNAADEHSVRISSNSGEFDELLGENREEIKKIVDAINEAIIFKSLER